MRVTFVLPTASMSGGTRVVAIYAEALSQMGHKVTIVSQPPSTIPVRLKVKSWIKGNRWPRDAARWKSHLDGTGLNHKVLGRRRPITAEDVPDAEVIVATWWETAEWVNGLGAEKGVKVYFIQHHEIFPYLPVDRCRATYLLPFHKIAVARWLGDLMSSEYYDDDVDIVPNSVDRNQFFASVRGKQPRPTVGFLYSPAPSKGLNIAYAALALVRKRYPELRLVVFGNLPPIPELPLPENAEFFLSPPQEQIRDLYAQCDVWVTASQSEGFNLPALEAMACRTPVVSTRAGWPEEAVRPGWNGILVNVDDMKGLAEGIEWVLSRSDAEWRTLSSNALVTSSSGSWEESSVKFANALARACAKQGRRGA